MATSLMATNRTAIEYSMMGRAALQEKKVETKARRKLYHDGCARLKAMSLIVGRN